MIVMGNISSIMSISRRGLVIGMKKKSEVGRERINGCSGCGKVLKELLEGLVAEELVPPLRKGLFQVDPELFSEFHCTNHNPKRKQRNKKSKATRVICGTSACVLCLGSILNPERANPKRGEEEYGISEVEWG